MPRKTALAKGAFGKSKELLKKFSVFSDNDYLSKIGFNEMFRVPDTLLRTLGLSGIHSVFDKTPVSEKKNEAVFSLTFVAVLFNILSLIHNAVHQWERHPHRTLKITSMIFTNTLGWCAGVLMHNSTKKIKDLLEDLKISWMRELRVGVGDAFIRSARRSISFTIFYAILIFTLSALHLILPIGHRIHNFATGDKGTDFDSEVVLLPVRYPFKIDTDLKYVLCAIFEVSCTIFLAMTYLGVDSLFHQSTTIVCLLLQTVGKKFGEVAVYAKGNMVDRRVWRQLHHIGEQHCELLLYCRRIEEIFNPLIFLMTLFTSANLCVSVISLQLELSSLQLGNIVILLTQVAAIVLQPFIYCNSAENISHRTKNIATSIYMCQWPEQTEKFKKIVLLIMLRSQHNYKFGQYGLFKVNHHLLTQLIHTAWNFLMILKKWEMPL